MVAWCLHCRATLLVRHVLIFSLQLTLIPLSATKCKAHPSNTILRKLFIITYLLLFI
ncbi:hypothetical protein Lalb_Chr08g0235101 [Lupinus albus]|uniref:Uncharacterized protein n=1 Tax=Lupinus albus TaxID=3870 RepID=A0A6A4Q4N5_LUPAL|nr:hypothetical protein Lalb_Chr08g0235101 [Lupinus albus]